MNVQSSSRARRTHYPFELSIAIKHARLQSRPNFFVTFCNYGKWPFTSFENFSGRFDFKCR